MLEVRIGHSSTEFILIEVIGRTHPESVDYWDGNWLNAQVRIRAGGFQGKVNGYLRTEEFITFREELTHLYKTISGSATFTTMEEWLSIEIVGDGRGHITAQCTVMESPGIGNTLQFNLELDQTFLPGTIEGLGKINSQYPTIGSK